MYHGRTAEIRRRAASSLTEIATPLAVSALEDSRATLDSLLRYRVDLLLRSRQHRAAVREARDPIELGRKLDQRFAKESREILKRSQKLVDNIVTEKLEGVELRSEPVPVPDITEGGLGYRLDFEPRAAGAATYRVWMGIRTVSFGIGPRNPTLTWRWTNPIGRGSHLLGVEGGAGLVRKGKVVEKVDPQTGGSVARLGTGTNADYLSTASNLPEFKRVPLDWETLEYEPYD